MVYFAVGGADVYRAHQHRDLQYVPNLCLDVPDHASRD